MFESAPKSYKDPFWRGLAESMESEVGLPSGLLQNVLLRGERSNADQVSSAGARTPFQIIPQTREAVRKKYGVDAYSSPESSAKAAALLLKESLDRNNGSTLRAVQEYHGGTDPKNYGPINAAYTKRVLGDMQQEKQPQLSEIEELLRMYDQRTKAGGLSDQAPAPQNEVDELLAMYDAKKKPAPAIDREAAIAQIPTETGAPLPAPTVRETPNIRDYAEAGLGMVSGATSGLLGGVLGAVDAVPAGLIKGNMGERIKQGFATGLDAGTYTPSREAGRRLITEAGEFITGELKAPPVMPIVGPTGALAPAIAAQRPIQQAGQVAAKASAAAKAAPDMLKRLPSRVQESLASMDRFAKRQGSAGAQGVDISTVRREAAGELPVPIELTKGQASRDFDQTRFERETAKDAERGKPLRDYYADQNKKLLMNMDSFIDQTGAETTSKIQTGKVITKALMDRAQADKVKINELYKKAEQSPEAMQPIKIDSVFEYINNNKAEAAVSPALKFAKAKAIELGMATETPDGRLIGRPITLIEGERLRKAIGAATGNDAPDIRQASILKGLYDSDTENAGGALYKTARRARENYAKRFENRAVIADLLETKRNSDDRRVALEDVQSRIIDKGSREDLSILMGILGSSGDEGMQAIKELRGATLMKIKANATKSANSDEMGNPIVSADKLNSSIRQLDEDGKLERLYGKKGAEQLRTLADVAKVVLTVPAGSVNYSNTASVLAGLTDVALTGLAQGVPMPIATTARLLAKKVKDKRVQTKINEALGKNTSKEK